MQTGRFRNVPLVDDDRRLVGVVRQVDILKFLAESFPEELLNLPPTTPSAHGAGRRRMTTTHERIEHDVQELDRVTIRFAGDSGDGMQLTGTQFTRTAAVFGNDISTFPDFPAEIRAPAGSPARRVRASRSASRPRDIHTPGDAPDVLVAMNPAALKTNVGELPAGGALIVNSDAFTQQNLNKAAYASNPLTDGSLKQYTVFEVPISTLNERSLDGLEMTSKQKDLTKNFFALGLMFWLYERSMDPTITLDRRRSSAPGRSSPRRTRGRSRRATRSARRPRCSTRPTASPQAKLDPGTYRNITGNEATALGFLTASKLAKRQLFYGSYPITPASDILHQLSGYKHFGVKTFQAEDEIAAIGAAIGAALRRRARADRHVRPRHRAQAGGDRPRGHGRAAARGHRRPARRPVDRHADQDRAGRPADGPVRPQRRDRRSRSSRPRRPASASRSRSRRARIALKYMTPVIYMSDAFLANGAEPWKVPALDDLPDISVAQRGQGRGPFLPYARDPETLGRPWAVPGTPGLEHRIGGLEKADSLGNVSYDPDNHHRMSSCGPGKVAGIARDIPPLDVFGPEEGDLLILGWGCTYGAIRSAVERCRRRASRSPTRTSATSTRSRPTPATSSGATARSSSRSSTSASSRCSSGHVPRRRRRLQPGQRQAVPHRRRSSTRPTASSTSAG